ncbi:histone H3-like centromeric protein HTR12 [Anopheles stephensi]|uniref:histone H3-like centromeric protein HTR12 n=1 Tax=Anopheles stephensi TaxID=30069 RepID=UPI001658983B|nr:histone H3-like centromeric protein HTR12 [Anopheles stephensi]
MAPRKKTTKKAPAKPANPPARREAPESPAETVRRTDRGGGEFRSLRTGDELRNVMGTETDDSVSNSENESYRSNTIQSRPNFSFLPSHKHSSPNTDKRTLPTAHRLTSMSTVPNTGLEQQESSSASRTPSAGSNTNRKSSRAVNREASSSTSSQRPQREEPQPSSSKQPHSRKQQKPNQLKMLKDVIYLQSTVHNLIPKMCFARVIREILSEYSSRAMRVTPEMLYCLQEAAEIYLVQLFEDSYRCTMHRDRITLMPKDMQLACILRRK